MSDVHGKLADLWIELLKSEEVTADTDFFESGGTSIVAVYLAAEIQEAFHVPVDAIEVVSHPRFGDLTALVGERLAGAVS
ncbi:acyl carrier protein [Streptomyces sp. M19]